MPSDDRNTPVCMAHSGLLARVNELASETHIQRKAIDEMKKLALLLLGTTATTMIGVIVQLFVTLG